MWYPKSDALRRLALEVWFALHAAWGTWKIRREIDIAVFVLPPVSFALICKRILPRRVLVVGLVHDLQGLMMEAGIVTGRGVLARLVQRVEGVVLRSCNTVVCLSQAMARFVTHKLNVSERQCKVCYPFAIRQSGDDLADLSNVFEAGAVHVVYSGALGQKQMPDVLWQLFERVCEIRSDVVCHIFSRGREFNRLLARKKEMPGSRVRFHDLVPESALGALYRSSDIQVIPQAEGTGSAAFPSKLPNLLMAGVPVFAICDGASELAELTRECGGVVRSAADMDGMVDGLLGLIETCRDRSHGERYAAMAPLIHKLFSIDELTAVILGKRFDYGTWPRSRDAR